VGDGLRARVDAWRESQWRWHPTPNAPERQTDINPWVPSGVARQFASAVRNALHVKSTCVPDGYILISIVNQPMSALRRLGTSRIAHLRCLTSRIVSLCLAGYRDTLGTCVVTADDDSTQANEHAAAFLSTRWHELSWAKWSLLHIALTAGSRGALFVDADVVLFHNPFQHFGLPRPDAEGASALLLHQEDAAACMDVCNRPCRINTGVLFVTSGWLCAEVLRQLYPKQIKSKMPLDQDVLQWGLRRFLRQDGNVTTCRLPHSFVGHCAEQSLRVKRQWSSCKLVAYHATCSANASMKLSNMRAVLEEANRCHTRSHVKTEA
jgi:hypothetical protein